MPSGYTLLCQAHTTETGTICGDDGSWWWVSDPCFLGHERKNKKRRYDGRSLKWWSVLLFKCVLFFRRMAETKRDRGKQLAIWEVVNVMPYHGATDDRGWHDIPAG